MGTRPGGDETTCRAAPRRWVIWLLGTALVVAAVFFATYAYVVVQSFASGQTSLLRGPVVFLFFLVVGNLAAVRFLKRRGLTQAELLILYVMLCMATCAGGYGFVQFIVNLIAAPFHYATPSNGWEQKLWPHIPAWFSPRDEEVLRPFFRGESSLYRVEFLAAWAVPVAAWTLFVFAIFWVLMCAAALFRRQWVEAERLTFPLAYLPIEMTHDGGGGGFWRNRLMWAGFVLAGAVESLNYLGFLYPAVPSIPIKPIGGNMLDTYITAPPWNSMGALRLAFYPWVIGIAFGLQRDVSFSCWFLYLCVKAANVASAAMGQSEGGGTSLANRAPFIREQSVGAFIGLALLALWSLRGPLAQAWREARAGRAAPDGELMPIRWAVMGGGAGVAVLVGFLVCSGLPVHLAALFVAVYLAFALTLGRIVSEAGAGWAFSPIWTPAGVTTDAFGADRLSPRSLVILQGYGAWVQDMRDNPFPHQMKGLRMAQSGGFAPGALLWPLVWAALIGTLAAFWAHLHIYYEYGQSSAKVRAAVAKLGLDQMNRTAGLIASPTPQDTVGMVAAGAGLVIALGLAKLRLALPWWPIHPLGYALATTPSMDYMWCPFFVAWALKSLVVRFGGVKLYRATLPFFLGLVLGDYVVPTFWAIWGMASGTQQYMPFPH